MAASQHFQVIVIGAGASGLFCALTAAQRGRSVLVVDSANKVGKKILMSGGGRCNFTNLDITPENYLCSNPHFVKSALKRYTQWDFIELVARHNISYHERNHGELFCDDSAKQILAMLLQECQQAGALVRSSCTVADVAQCQQGYLLTINGVAHRCEALVVATGGLSIPTLGGSGLGYQLAEQFGLAVLPRRAGLVPFTFSDALKQLCTDNSGTAIEVEMSVPGASWRDNLLFTHRGLSGPAALQISNYWQPGSALSIDLLPELQLSEWLLQAKRQQPKSLLRTVLAPLLTKSLAASLEGLLWPQLAQRPLAEIGTAALQTVAAHLHNWQIKPAGTEGYRTAEVTLAGVDTDYLSSKTMESKQHPGLYFIGEVVDVTGHLGGYNFQWAWSSGFAAGQAV